MPSRERWRAQLVTSSGEGDGGLDALVSQLRLDEGRGASQLDLKLSGRQVRVELLQTGRDDGSKGRQIEGVRLSVQFERAPGSKPPKAGPSISLRRETEGDVRDKERGLTREVQTGHAGFDCSVFIDNDSSEADVHRVLATEATRQAVLRLLDAGHASVQLGSSSVSVGRWLNDGVVRPGPVLDALEDLLIVARAGGPQDAAPPRRGEVLLLVATGVAAATVCYGYLTWDAWPTSLAVLALGATAGAIVAFLSRPSIEAACSGDSSSARRAAAVLLLAWLASGALVFGALEHVNGAFDLSEGETWRGVLTSSGSSRHPLRPSPVGVHWEDGSTSFIAGDGSMQKGDRISERRHPGVLGFTWFDGRRVTRK